MQIQKISMNSCCVTAVLVSSVLVSLIGMSSSGLAQTVAANQFSNTVQVLAELDGQDKDIGSVERDWLDNSVTILTEQQLAPGQYKVMPGDTLWKIARRLRFAGISVVQVMEAIFRYNSAAFEDGDVTAIVVGSVILLPTEEEVRSEFGAFVSPGIERIEPDRIQSRALISSIRRSALEQERAANLLIKRALDEEEGFNAIEPQKNETTSSNNMELNDSSLKQSDLTKPKFTGFSALLGALVFGSGLFGGLYMYSRRASKPLPKKTSGIDGASNLDDLNFHFDEADGLEIKLFDERDTEIFPNTADEVSSRFFDSMVDPMIDAEMYMSVGKIDEAIDVLQEERFAKPQDAACRVRLMQILYEEARFRELEKIYTEIERTGDHDSVAAASKIVQQSLFDELKSEKTDSTSVSNELEEGQDKSEFVINESEDSADAQQREEIVLPQGGPSKEPEATSFPLDNHEQMNVVDAGHNKGFDQQNDRFANLDLSKTNSNDSEYDLENFVTSQVDDEALVATFADDALQPTQITASVEIIKPEDASDKPVNSLILESESRLVDAKDWREGGPELDSLGYDSHGYTNSDTKQKFSRSKEGKNTAAILNTKKTHREITKASDSDHSSAQASREDSDLMKQRSHESSLNQNQPSADVVQGSDDNFEDFSTSETFQKGLVVGDLCSGIVTSLSPLGALLDLGESIGVLNVNDIAWKRVSNPSLVLDIGDEINVKVLAFDTYTQKYEVGMKQLEDDPWKSSNISDVKVPISNYEDPEFLKKLDNIVTEVEPEKEIMPSGTKGSEDKVDQGSIQADIALNHDDATESELQNEDLPAKRFIGTDLSLANTTFDSVEQDLVKAYSPDDDLKQPLPTEQDKSREGLNEINVESYQPSDLTKDKKIKVSKELPSEMNNKLETKNNNDLVNVISNELSDSALGRLETGLDLSPDLAKKMDDKIVITSDPDDSDDDYRGVIPDMNKDPSWQQFDNSSHQDVLETSEHISSEQVGAFVEDGDDPPHDRNNISQAEFDSSQGPKGMAEDDNVTAEGEREDVSKNYIEPDDKHEGYDRWEDFEEESEEELVEDEREDSEDIELQKDSEDIGDEEEYEELEDKKEYADLADREEYEDIKDHKECKDSADDEEYEDSEDEEEYEDLEYDEEYEVLEDDEKYEDSGNEDEYEDLEDEEEYEDLEDKEEYEDLEDEEEYEDLEDEDSEDDEEYEDLEDEDLEDEEEYEDLEDDEEYEDLEDEEEYEDFEDEEEYDGLEDEEEYDGLEDEEEYEDFEDEEEYEDLADDEDYEDSGNEEEYEDLKDDEEYQASECDGEHEDLEDKGEYEDSGNEEEYEDLEDDEEYGDLKDDEEYEASQYDGEHEDLEDKGEYEDSGNEDEYEDTEDDFENRVEVNKSAAKDNRRGSYDDLNAVATRVDIPEDNIDTLESLDDSLVNVSSNVKLVTNEMGDISMSPATDDTLEDFTKNEAQAGSYPDKEDEGSVSPVTKKTNVFGRLFERLRPTVGSAREAAVKKLPSDLDDSIQTSSGLHSPNNNQHKGDKIHESSKNSDVTTSALTGQEKPVDISLDSDDFDHLFEGHIPNKNLSPKDEKSSKDILNEASSISDTTLFESENLKSQEPPPLVNPEDLGLLQLYDEQEASENDVSLRTVEPEDDSTDLVEELEDLENFLEIQSKLVGHTDVHEKTNLGLVNIDSVQVKFAIVEAYIVDNNKAAATDLLKDIISQKDEYQERAKLMLEKL